MAISIHMISWGIRDARPKENNPAQNLLMWPV